MKIPAMTRDLASVPEWARQLYTKVESGEQAGAFLLGVEGAEGFTLENTTSLRETLQRERAETRKAQALLTAWGELNPDETKARLKMFEGVTSLDELKKSKSSEEIERIKTQLAEKHEGERKTWQEREKKLVGSVDQHLRRAVGLSAINEHGGNPLLLEDAVLRHLVVKETDKGFQTVVVDPATGQELISRKEGSTGSMSPSELVETIFKKNVGYGPAFRSTGATGAGSESGRGGDGGNAIQGGAMTITQKDSQDFGRYKAAKEAAAKAGVSLQIVE